MVSQVLFIIGASIFGLLGIIHILYTFFTDKFTPYNSDVTTAMKSTTVIITKETTVWRAWVGFNASHSLGALLFSAIYLPLAFSHMPFITHNSWFAILPSIIGFSYLLLAKNYWFKIPLLSILVSTICFVSAFVLIKIE
jgi:hypothetical protein